MEYDVWAWRCDLGGGRGYFRVGGDVFFLPIAVLHGLILTVCGSNVNYVTRSEGCGAVGCGDEEFTVWGDGGCCSGEGGVVG